MYGPEPPPQTPAPTPVSAAQFRVKAAFMKTWKPGQTPSNRDRLELYAWHKQAVTGDAPLTTSPNTAQDAASRAKWNAWRSKRGMDQAQSMARYVAEANRQLLVYGTIESLSTNGNKQPYNHDTTVTPSLTPTTPAHHVSSSGGNGAGGSGSGDELLTPRGLAAVPLLCAATAETRVAYLARLSQTLPDHGWWARQEALCGMPGSFAALPESVVLFVACRVEGLSLHSKNGILQSFLWPLHNVLLALWILVIFIGTLVTSVGSTLKTILLGSKQTGLTLGSIWEDELMASTRTASALTDVHQAMTIRLVGLLCLPLVHLGDLSQWIFQSSNHTLLLACTVYLLGFALTWWYWLCVLPWMGVGAAWMALCSGWCFALIEAAGV